MDAETAFAAIQQTLQSFDAEVSRARADQAASLEALACVEYELAQLRKLLSETALEPAAPAPHNPAGAPPGGPAPGSDVEIAGENVAGGLLLRRLVPRAA